MVKRIFKKARISLSGYIIPQNHFRKVRGMCFLLICNIDVSKLPLKLQFHQQALSAAKLYFVHNLSPHKTIIWTNEFITWKKLLFLKNWINKGIIYLKDLQNNDGEIFCYEDFFWSNVSSVTSHYNKPIVLKAKYVTLYNNKDKKTQHIIHVIIIIAKFHIQKTKVSFF